MQRDYPTLAEAIRQNLDKLTATQRKPARLLLANYPFAGLETVARFAALAGVSGPTVLRLINKLGYAAYADFQQALKRELEARVQSPITRQRPHSGTAGGSSQLLDAFVEVLCENLRQSAFSWTAADLDGVVNLLADSRRRVYLLGGRLTEPVASYLFVHLHALRPRVLRIEGQTDTWPESLLDMSKTDILLVFDIRRYQNDVVKFARQAAARGVQVVLFTDQWLSPVSKFATLVFACHTQTPSNWDSSVSILALLDILISALNQRQWPTIHKRMGELEELRGNLSPRSHPQLPKNSAVE